MGKFTEAKLEHAIIQLLGEQGYPHVLGDTLSNGAEGSRGPTEVLIKGDLRAYLNKQYRSDGITDSEIERVIRQLELLSASDLYDSNKTFCKWLSDGFPLKRDNHTQK
ncbi:MAG: type I restriction endonuclease, partial [Colwellia sp.]